MAGMALDGKSSCWSQWAEQSWGMIVNLATDLSKSQLHLGSGLESAGRGARYEIYS